jgi:ribonucleoside-diphosphate reductase alpha chain
MIQTIGPQTVEADALHAMKYRAPGEDFREAMNRISFGLKDSDNHYHELRNILLPMCFLPGGRIQSAIGATRQVTAYNCFVSGTIADSYVDGPGNIMQRAHEAASTMRMGGGIGYDFSTLRPRGDRIRKLQSNSSGPISFMRIFNEICLCTSSSGHRRGAQMGILRVDHPDVEEFIRAKQNTDQLTGFNMSIAVTDEFLEAALSGKSFDLRFKGEVYRTIDAASLWETIMRSTWDYGEPGVIFIDRINQMNNLWYCEEIAATNPCGEQPLPPFGACLLGSFNLTKYLVRKMAAFAEPQFYIDLDSLRHDIPAVVRGMDNVIDRSIYALPSQKAEAITKRRMGLGVTGLANALEAAGLEYASPKFIAMESTILETITSEAYRASAMLAKEKGSFPLYDPEKYLQGKFIATLPEDVRDLIAKHGIRNSHLTSIAPTGTISMCADNVSSGLEPVFAYEIERAINTPAGATLATIYDYGKEFLHTAGRLASEVLPMEHVAVVSAAQNHIDSAVSKTINMDGKQTDWSSFKYIYQNAWETGCKSCTTFNISGKRTAMMKAVADDDNQLAEESCDVDLLTGRRNCE